ncbi:MAG: DNA replication/repair protein RecF [Bacteroidales bacterium]|nr:DNA replication/repair protein RecF [Bacteroidales bacterium]
MYLKSLNLSNFKNYSESEIKFSAKINCFVGDNGVGKTNILDAIHYLSLTKSYFTNIDSNCIKHGEDFFLIKGSFPSKEEIDIVFCGFQKGKKKTFKHNSKEYSRLADHIGLYPVVMISPADSSIISDGSEERRKFMNGVISQYDRDYLDAVMRYNKALKNRNILLKQYGLKGGYDREMLQLWEEQMIPAAEQVYSKRSMFLEELIPVFQEYYNHISDVREKVDLQYKSQLKEGNLRELLEASLQKDRVLQYTTVGIHRDDMKLMMNKYPIRDLGSQGQQKSYMVALKLSKFEYIKKKGGVKPILLMDDIFDKFDASRVARIIELVADERFGQIFITDTHRDRLNLILSGSHTDYKLFKIDKDIEEIIVNGKASNNAS